MPKKICHAFHASVLARMIYHSFHYMMKPLINTMRGNYLFLMTNYCRCTPKSQEFEDKLDIYRDLNDFDLLVAPRTVHQEMIPYLTLICRHDQPRENIIEGQRSRRAANRSSRRHLNFLESESHVKLGLATLSEGLPNII